MTVCFGSDRKLILPVSSSGKYLYCWKGAKAKVLSHYLKMQNLYLEAEACTECLAVRAGEAGQKEMCRTDTLLSRSLQGSVLAPWQLSYCYLCMTFVEIFVMYTWGR